MLAESEEREVVEAGPAPEPPAGGLVHVGADQPGIARRRAGRGWVYLTADRARVTDPAVIARIRALAIPPAWRDVWICDRPDGHIQAIGFDARGRKQYRYHADFRRAREGAKFEHLVTFAEGLPSLRRQVAADMARPGLGREKVLATVVQLLETTMIRVGNAAYARDNDSYGLTTLRRRHVQIEGGALRFEFKGKSGKVWRLGVRDRRLARIVKACQDLPGQHLFGYRDGAGALQAITSCDVNAYLKSVTGRDISAKDFRTWTATVLAAEALAATEPPPCRKALGGVIKSVAARLGNTPTVCRASYIHPEIIEAWLTAALTLRPDSEAEGLSATETAVLDFLRRRLTAGGGAATTPPDRDARIPA